MSTKRRKTASSYKRYTPVQLTAKLRKLQRQFAVVSSSNKSVRGKSVQQQCKAIAREIKTVATALRNKVVQQINVKIKTLKSEVATSAAAKRLKAKVKQIQKCNRVSTLIKCCTGVKLSKFKNPLSRKKRTTGVKRRASAARKTSARRTTSKKRRTTTKKRGTATKARKTRTTKARSKSKKVIPAIKALYKRETKMLKNELNKLKKRNSFMTRLVNKFRKKVAKLQRSYKAASAKPRWKVVHGGRSNVVRLHRRTTNRSVAQRRAS